MFETKVVTPDIGPKQMSGWAARMAMQHLGSDVKPTAAFDWIAAHCDGWKKRSGYLYSPDGRKRTLHALGQQLRLHRAMAATVPPSESWTTDQAKALFEACSPPAQRMLANLVGLDHSHELTPADLGYTNRTKGPLVRVLKAVNRTADRGVFTWDEDGIDADPEFHLSLACYFEQAAEGQ
jgi:hypothetical protein